MTGVSKKINVMKAVITYDKSRKRAPTIPKTTPNKKAVIIHKNRPGITSNMIHVILTGNKARTRIQRTNVCANVYKLRRIDKKTKESRGKGTIFNMPPALRKILALSRRVVEINPQHTNPVVK
jgi:hypothetical protein